MPTNMSTKVILTKICFFNLCHFSKLIYKCSIAV